MSTAYYPFGVPGVISPQTGIVTSVPIDGSAPAPVVFQVPFTTAVSSIVLSVIGTGAMELSPQVGSGTITLNGFSIVVVGGAPGATASVCYVAYGA